MLRRLVVLALLAAACGGKQPPPGPAPVANTRPSAPAPYPAALYAGLFRADATFRYHVATQSEHWDDQDPRADASGMVRERGEHVMTCTVTQVEPLPRAIASVVECDDQTGVPVGGGDPSGTYLATERGLWRMGSPEQARTTAPLPEDVIVPWPPVERHRDDGGVWIDLDRGTADAWCWSKRWSEGDDGGVSLCFANGAIDSGSSQWAGGSSREAQYELVR
jgi:hypothetical protein